MSSILIISPSLKIGGIERALTVLANEFVNHNLNVNFIACLPGNQQYPLDSRVQVIYADIKYKRGRWGKLLFYTKLLFFLRKQTKQINPDVILSFGDAFNPLVLLALLGTSNKVYISDRTSPTFQINPLAKLLKKFLYPRCTGFIAQTKRMELYQKQFFRNRLPITVIPNAIELVKSKSALLRTDSILYVGRLSWEKGVDRLITAFAQLSSETWKLEIVGSGPAEQTLKALAMQLGCDDRLIFHGMQQDPVPYYLSSSIFVLPSHVEGFPNALCEAMSAGMAAVCFESIPYEAIIEHGRSGLVAKKDNVEDLVTHLEFLMSHAEEREAMGKEASAAVQQFDRSKIALRYLQFMNLI